MAADVTARAAAVAEALASAAATLEAPSVQEDVSSALLAEFLKDSRKKEKLLWGQLQVVDALQSFLEHMDEAVNPEEEIRAEVSAAHRLWKDLKAEYLKQTEAVEAALLQALVQLEAGQRKQLLLRSTLQQIQTKGRALEEWRSRAQTWRRQEQAWCLPRTNGDAAWCWGRCRKLRSSPPVRDLPQSSVKATALLFALPPSPYCE